MVDGNLFPYTGKITFADPSYNSHDRARSCLRATVNNPTGVLRPEPVRARAPDGRHSPERDRGSAARGPAERQGTFRLGRQQAEPGRAAAGRRSANGRAKAGSSPRDSTTATRSWSTAACASREGADVKTAPTYAAGPATATVAEPASGTASAQRSRAPTAVRRRAILLRQGAVHARRRTRSAAIRIAIGRVRSASARRSSITGYADRTGQRRRQRRAREEACAGGARRARERSASSPSASRSRAPVGRHRQRQRRPGAPRRRRACQ